MVGSDAAHPRAGKARRGSLVGQVTDEQRSQRVEGQVSTHQDHCDGVLRLVSFDDECRGHQLRSILAVPAPRVVTRALRRLTHIALDDFVQHESTPCYRIYEGADFSLVHDDGITIPRQTLGGSHFTVRPLHL